ncbi:MAG TPA: sigma 54-interacting transcriptional regulator [Fibrobacteraceae bacterium]|nr:sigma 54-interacting transcriptional regulator [Fibrobacteraceae bacterium]
MDTLLSLAETHFRCPRRNECDLSELKLLFSISDELSQHGDIHKTLIRVLEILGNQRDVVRGMIAILDRNSSTIQVEAASGLNEEERERGKYRLGEGIIGKAIQTGKPILVPRIAEEPLFLDRTRSRSEAEKSELSFLCVPVFVDNQVAGAIAVDKKYQANEDYEEDSRVLSIVGTMVARAVQSRQEEMEERRRLQEENDRLNSQLASQFHLGDMQGNAGAMQEVYRHVSQVASTNTTVLIRGESGVGKELIAEAIHYNSPRVKGPFIRVNISALPEELVESELFGYEPGAFTSATKLRRGRFELADGGTIFLDEIGDISASTQVKLLRALQEREFERLGGTTTLKVNVRIICATNRDLEKMIEENRFRKDLFYRINVFPIYVPPLRERKSDIPLLADHFIHKFNEANGTSVRRLSTSALEMLMSYSWPGNVRELENCIERACILAKSGAIYGFHFPTSLQSPASVTGQQNGGLEATLGKVEKELLVDALKAAHGNVAAAARKLGITERMMGIRVRKYGIDASAYKRGATVTQVHQ